MKLIRVLFAFVCAWIFSDTINAQDTFYVKKRQNPAPTVEQPRSGWGDTTIKDCVLTFTVEFQKPGTNIWVVLHCKGPRLRVPPNVQPTGNRRVLFTEIICIDRSGKKYQLSDRYYVAGVWAEVPKK